MDDGRGRVRTGLSFHSRRVLNSPRFLSVAQAFTRHLHHAEYQRLKRIAMRKNQDASKSITRSRVTNANQSKSSVKRMEIESKSRAVTKHTEEVLDEMGADEAARDEIDDSDDSDRVAIGDKQLAGLMYGEDSPTARRQLSSVTGASGKSKTRAAAGFGSNSSIDAQRIAPTSSLESGHSQGIGKANYTNQTVPSSHTHSISTVDNPAIEDLASRSRRMENSGTKASISKLSMVNIPAKTEPREGKGEEDGNLPAKPLVNPHGPSLMARRKARAAKKRKEAVSKDDEIPMFLG